MQERDKNETTIKVLEDNVKDLQMQLAWAYKKIAELQNSQHDNPVITKWPEVKKNIDKSQR